jgi:uncharacterized protein with HEPN domain
MRNSLDYLLDLKQEAEAVEKFTSDGKVAFMTDERNQYAVMMAYARIGEIVKRIPDDILQQQPHIEWREIKGFRDILLHRYFDVNVARVWEAVEKLPPLLTAINQMIKTLPEQDDL